MTQVDLATLYQIIGEFYVGILARDKQIRELSPPPPPVPFRSEPTPDWLTDVPLHVEED